MALRVGEPEREIRARLLWSLDRVPGAVGINNHEGSRFTADAGLLAPVVAVLAPRHLYFFDSRTIASSKVVPVARAAGVLSAERDVFLDDDATPDAIARYLSDALSYWRRGDALPYAPDDAEVTRYSRRAASRQLAEVLDAVVAEANGAT